MKKQFVTLVPGLFALLASAIASAGEFTAKCAIDYTSLQDVDATQLIVYLGGCKVLSTQGLSDEHRRNIEKNIENNHSYYLIVDELVDIPIETSKSRAFFKSSLKRHVPITFSATWVDEPSWGENGTIGWIVKSLKSDTETIEKPDTWIIFDQRSELFQIPKIRE